MREEGLEGRIVTGWILQVAKQGIADPKQGAGAKSELWLSSQRSFQFQNHPNAGLLTRQAK